MERKIKVGIIDDNPSLSEGLKFFFKDTNIECVFSCNSKESFLENLNHHIVDLVLVDVIMPDVVGLELFVSLNEKHPFLPVLVYSNIRNIQLINDLFRLKNIYGLVSKSDELTKLNEMITAIATEKNRVFPDEFLNLDKEGISMKLSERELEVLDLLSKGLSSKVIGDQLEISENTVLFHRKNLFKTFNTSNVYHLIVEAKECGFLK